MKLIKAIDIGKECGMSTIDQTIDLIDLNSISMFSYTKLSSELNELFKEYYDLLKAHKIRADSSLEEVLNVLKKEEDNKKL